MFQRLVITDVDQYPQLHAYRLQTKISAIFILPEALESLVVMNAVPIRIGVYSCDSWVFNIPWSWSFAFLAVPFRPDVLGSMRLLASSYHKT